MPTWPFKDIIHVSTRLGEGNTMVSELCHQASLLSSKGICAKPVKKHFVLRHLWGLNPRSAGVFGRTRPAGGRGQILPPPPQPSERVAEGSERVAPTLRTGGHREESEAAIAGSNRRQLEMPKIAFPKWHHHHYLLLPVHSEKIKIIALKICVRAICTQPYNIYCPFWGDYNRIL